MIRKWFVSCLLILFIQAFLFAQDNTIHTREVYKIPEIPFDPSDEAYIKDAYSEMYVYWMRLMAAHEKVEALGAETRAIFISYCKCTEKEYDDYEAGNGLPSIVNRLNQTTLSVRDSNRIREIQERIRSIGEYSKKYDTLYQDTIKMVVTRLESEFKKNSLSATRIEDYIPNIKALVFKRRVEADKPLSIREALEGYFFEYIKENSKELSKRLEKDIAESQLVSQSSGSKSEVIKAAQAYKESLEKLLELQQEDYKKALDLLEKQKASNENTERAKSAVEAAEAKIAGTKRQIADADNIIHQALIQADSSRTVKKNPGRKPASKTSRKAKDCKGCITT